MRSKEKGQYLVDRFKQQGLDKFEFVVVEDIEAVSALLHGVLPRMLTILVPLSAWSVRRSRQGRRRCRPHRALRFPPPAASYSSCSRAFLLLILISAFLRPCAWRHMRRSVHN